MVEDRAFREDLFYRLAVLPIEIPPLRERPSDILEMVPYFFEKGKQKHSVPNLRLPPDLLPAFTAYRWPGNIRQLENFIEQAVVLAEGDVLTERDLFSHDPATVAPAPVLSGSYEPGMPLREVERRHILRTLQKVGGNRTEAARQLQISVRCLQYKLKEYQVGPTTSLEAAR